MGDEVLIEMDPAEAPEVVAALRENGINVDDPDEVQSLDGTTLASFIVTVTPVVAPYIVKVIQAMRGKTGKIRRGNMILELDNYSREDLEAIFAAEVKDE